MCSGEIEKNEMIKNHKRASFFIELSFRTLERFFFYFVFEKTSSSLPMLFVHVGKRSRKSLRSSRSQMFFKIGVLKKFSISQ